MSVKEKLQELQRQEILEAEMEAEIAAGRRLAQLQESQKRFDEWNSEKHLLKSLYVKLEDLEVLSVLTEAQDFFPGSTIRYYPRIDGEIKFNPQEVEQVMLRLVGRREHSPRGGVDNYGPMYDNLWTELRVGLGIASQTLFVNMARYGGRYSRTFRYPEAENPFNAVEYRTIFKSEALFSELTRGDLEVLVAQALGEYMETPYTDRLGIL